MPEVKHSMSRVLKVQETHRSVFPLTLQRTGTINLQSSLIYHTSFFSDKGIKYLCYYGSSNKTSLVTKGKKRMTHKKFLDVYLQSDNFLTVLHITVSFFIIYEAAIFVRRENYPFLIKG